MNLKVHQTNVGTIDLKTKGISEKTKGGESAVSLKTLDSIPKVSPSSTALDQSLYSTPAASFFVIYRLMTKKSHQQYHQKIILQLKLPFRKNACSSLYCDDGILIALSMDSENQPSEKLSSSELLLSASRVLSGILESPCWNLTPHQFTSIEKILPSSSTSNFFGKLSTLLKNKSVKSYQKNLTLCLTLSPKPWPNCPVATKSATKQLVGTSLKVNRKT